MRSVRQQKTTVPLWMKIAVLAAAFLAMIVWLAQLWQQQILAALVDSVESAAKARSPRGMQAQATDKLPPPVARYLSHVLPADRRQFRLARYQQVGTLRMDPRSDRWLNFKARQIIAPSIFEFIWDAKVCVLPLLHVRVRDSLVGGRGSGQVTFQSALPVGGASGTMEMNSGSLHRFLAEAVWYPAALLPDASLRWESVDDTRALATLTQGNVTVSLEFRFNQNNEVVGIYTPGRWGSFEGGYKQVAWEGRFRDYAKRDGVLVPNQGEVGWYTDGEWRAVWRGTVTQATFEFE